MSSTQYGTHVSSEFINLFNREVRNRAYAKLAVDELIAAQDGGEVLAFWLAYQKLEEMNLRKYRPYACKYHLPIDPDWFIYLKEYSGRLCYKLMPVFSLKVMQSAAETYVTKLEKLESIAPAEDRVFFRYVVLQEQSQVVALAHAMRQEYSVAAEILNKFMIKNKFNRITQ